MRCISLLALLILLVGPACSDDSCVEVDLACQPLYTPTFDEIFTRTLQPTCAVEGGACHSAEGAKAGLVFEDPDVAYQLLTGSTGDARVIPFDPGCSEIVGRVESTSPARVMPPGGRLPAAERCVIVQWIADGAKR